MRRFTQSTARRTLLVLGFVALLVPTTATSYADPPPPPPKPCSIPIVSIWGHPGAIYCIEGVPTLRAVVSQPNHPTTEVVIGSDRQVYYDHGAGWHVLQGGHVYAGLGWPPDLGVHKLGDDAVWVLGTDYRPHCNFYIGGGWSGWHHCD